MTKMMRIVYMLTDTLVRNSRLRSAVKGGQTHTGISDANASGNYLVRREESNGPGQTWY